MSDRSSRDLVEIATYRYFTLNCTVPLFGVESWEGGRGLGFEVCECWVCPTKSRWKSCINDLQLKGRQKCGEVSGRWACVVA